MRWELKIILFPIILLLSILIAFLKFIIKVSGMILDKATDKNAKNKIILKRPTGSGKTIILLSYIEDYLGIILAAYKAFEDRFSIIEEKLPAVELVRKATLQKLGRFTKQDIRERCPSLSVSSIEGALRKLIAEGNIKREGVGRATKYMRLK
ncbi:hypothetical protein [Peptostreptococcus sp. D1]|uniref:hypothetical protein n=1 Tax=Peptostreptococcus sp. D1 TaxID=72304 RepID=UPI0008F3CF7B|nr:hypothetical protein [Peptostreptococcus sp. D1]SFE22868.1 hypothetical protein SAMN02910278_00335 [Peptostreptococcus sp. D1]